MARPRRTGPPLTRAERAVRNGGRVETAIDPDTGKPYQTARTRTGRLIEKNRSDNTLGYKTHLSKKQLRLIAYALRQLDRGCTQEAVWMKIQPHWDPSPMQYPLTQGTVASWQLTRAAMRKRGKEWPVLTEETMPS